MCLLEKLEELVRKDAKETIEKDGLTEEATEKVHMIGNIQLARAEKKRKSPSKFRMKKTKT